MRTKDDAEVDLIIERPGLPLALIEIKSSSVVDDRDVASLLRFKRDIPKSEAYVLSLDPVPKKISGVHALHWQDGFKELGI